jgi:hypothetical protein
MGTAVSVNSFTVNIVFSTTKSGIEVNSTVERLISDLRSRGGCQVAERDCRNHSLWVSPWVRIFRPECPHALGDSSLQLRALGFGLLQNGDVGVGIFPEGEEVLVCGFGSGTITRHRIGATELKMCESTDG